jgi:hypothetical protein
MSLASGSLVPDKYDYSVKRGASFVALEYWSDASGNPFDFSLYTLKSHLRPTYSGSVKAGEFTVEPVGGATSGWIRLGMTPASCSLLTGSAYYYDVRLNDGTNVYYIAEGKLTLAPSITRE